MGMITTKCRLLVEINEDNYYRKPPWRNIMISNDVNVDERGGAHEHGLW